MMNLQIKESTNIKVFRIIPLTWYLYHPIVSDLSLMWISVAQPEDGACRQPDNPRNGGYVTFSVEQSNRVRFRCNSGFYLVGQAEQTCIAGVWVPTVTPQCVVSPGPGTGSNSTNSTQEPPTNFSKMASLASYISYMGASFQQYCAINVGRAIHK